MNTSLSNSPSRLPSARNLIGLCSALFLLLASAQVRAAVYYWDPQGTTGVNPYTGSMTGTWENLLWSSSSSGSATPVGWVEGDAACFAVHSGAGTPPYTVTMNSSHTVAGFFNGSLTPNSSALILTGTGTINLSATNLNGFSMHNASDGSLAMFTNAVVMAGGATAPICAEGNGQVFFNAANTFSGGAYLGYSGSSFAGIWNFNNSASFGVGGIYFSNLQGGALAVEGSSPVTIPNGVTNIQPASFGGTTSLNIVGNPAGVTFTGPWCLSGGTYSFSGTSSGTFPATFGLATVGIGSGGAANNLVTIAGVISGTNNINKFGVGILALGAANTYSGNTTDSAGTLLLTSSGSINNTPNLSILAGATFDVSAYPTFNLSSSTTLVGAGSNTAALSAIINGASGGVVNLGSQNINLVFSPTAFTGDATHPSLVISNGAALTLNNNTITVTNNSSTALGVGTYSLIQVGDGVTGTINGTPTATVPIVYGAGLAAGTVASLSVSGSTINLVVAAAATSTTTTLSAISAITYGQSSTFTATVAPVPDGGVVQFFTNGVAFGAPVAVDTGTGIATSAATSTSLAAGTWPVTASFGGSPDDSFGASSATAVSLVVNKATLTVTANTQSTTYGTAITLAGSTQFTPAGLQNGETIGSVTLAVTATPPYSTNSPVGSYTITPSAATGGTFTAANYSTITYTPATLGLTITAKALTLTANAQSRAYGSTSSTPITGQTTVTGTSGFVNGQTVSSLTVTLTFTGITTTTPVTGSPYTGVIVPSAAVEASGKTNFNPGNYNITYANGTLTITSLAVHVTGTQPYNGTNGVKAGTLTVSNPVGSDTVYPALGIGFLASSNPGSQAVASFGTLALANAGLLEPGTGTGPTAQFNLPAGMCVDTNGNIYVADAGNNRVCQITPGGVETVLPFTGLINPASVAVDGNTNAYVADPSLNEIVELTVAGVQSVVPFTGLNYPASVAVDVAGDVFVADTLNARIVEMNTSAVQSTLPLTGIYLPSGVAVDTNGDVFVANAGNNNVIELPFGGSQVTLLGFTGLNFGIAVAVDDNTNVYLANYGSGLVKRLAIANGLPGTLTTNGFNGILGAAGVAVDSAGDVYASDSIHNRIEQLNSSAVLNLSFAGTSNAPNYTTTGGSGTVIVTDTPVFSGLTSHSIAYGATVTLSGVVSGPGPTYPASGTLITVTINGNPETTTISGSAGAFSINYTTAGLPASVTPYTVTYSSAAAGAFNPATDSSTSLTVNPATVTITSGLTVNPVTYGSLSGLDSATLTSNNVVLAGVLAADLGNVELDTNGYTAAFTETNANPAVPVTVTGMSLTGSAIANYTLVEPSLTGAITQVPLTYTADPANQTYGSANTTFTGTVTGFVYSDTQASATAGSPAFASATVANSPVGSYPITGSGLTASNYTFVQAAGNATALTISQATLTYLATPAGQVYGTANTTFAGSVSGFVAGDTQAGATTGLLAFTSATTPNSPVGSYAITGSGLSAVNYTFIQDPANATALAISQATLTYVATAATQNYGSANTTFSGTVTGFVLPDTQATATTGTLAFTSATTATSPDGTYAITGSGLSAVNYTFVQAPGNATALTIVGAFTTWTGLAAPDTNWTTAGNWSTVGGSTPPGALDLVLFTNNATAPTSPYIVDAIIAANTAIHALNLQCTNGGTGVSGSDFFHTIQISNGVTLTVTGNVLAGCNSNSYTLKNTTAANMSGTGNFTSGSPTATFWIGASNVTSEAVTLTLADGTNTITAAGVDIGDSYHANGNPCVLNLGAGSNLINANFIGLGSGKSAGTLQFTNTTGGLTIRGSTGGSSRATRVIVSDQESGTATSNPSKMSLAGHPVNVMIGALTIGEEAGSSGGGESSPNSVSFDNGTFDVTSINMGFYSSGSAMSTTLGGAFTVGGNPVNTATLLVGSAGGGSLILGNSATAANISTGSLTINTNGIAQIYCPVTNNTQSTGTLTLGIDGTLILEAAGGAIGSAAVPLSKLALNGPDSLQLSVNSTTETTPDITATTVTASGLTTITINSIAGYTGGSVTYHLISYTGADPFAGLTTVQLVLPLGYVGTLVDNSASKHLDLNITLLQTITSTAVTLASGSDPSIYGSPLDFHAVVTPTPPDDGTVTFYANGSSIGVPVPTVSGAADLIYSSLPYNASAYAITAVYNGDTDNTGSTNSLAGGQAITQATLIPSVTVQSSKPYDGTAAATITGRSLSGYVNGDDATTVNLGSSGVANYSDPAIGTGKTVTITGLSLSGASAADYVLSTTTLTATADITSGVVTITSGLTAVNKVYDASAAASLSITNTIVLAGLSDADAATVTLSTNGYTAAFATTNATTNIPVTVLGLTLTGGNFADYTLTQPVFAATITPAPVSVASGLTVNPADYGTLSGLDAASLTSNNVTLSGVLPSDLANVGLDTNGYAAAFTDTNANPAVTVTVTGMSLTGSEATNYTLLEPSLTGAINQATLTYVATPASQIYGSANTAFSGDVTGFAYSDTLASATTGTLTFTSATTPTTPAGSYPITGSGLSASNYTFVQAAANATALTISGSGVSVPGAITIVNPGDGTIIITSAGTATGVYMIQVSSDLTSAANWTTITTNIAGAGGAFSVTNAASGAAQYYRTVSPP